MWISFLVLAACRPEPPPPPPSILVVVLDTIGANSVSAYGNPRPLTPQFDAVADAGVLFTDVTAPSSWTWPSHAALFTGEPPWVSGAHTAAADEGQSLGRGWLRVTPLRTDLPTLAERLEAAGYATSAFVANQLLGEDLGITRGFGRVVVGEQDPAVREGAVRQIQSEEARPQLVFVNFLGAHSPYQANEASWSRPRGEELAGPDAPAWARPYIVQPPGISFFTNEPGSPSGVERYARGELVIDADGRQLLRDLYEGEVLGVDRELNQLIRAWTARYPTGVVVVTADHGELLGEHGLIGHGSLVESRLTHVPLALVAPGRTAAHTRCALPVQLQDLYATILELAGVEDPAWSLMDAIGGAARPGPVLAAEWPDRKSVV